MKKVNHVKVAKFVMSKDELKKIKGGGKTGGGINCSCSSTTDNKCIAGEGSGISSL